MPYYFLKEFNKSTNSMPQITDIWTWQICVQVKVGN